MKYLVKNIKCGITEGGVACGPIDGNIVATIEYQEKNKVNWLSLVDVFGIPEFYQSDKNIFDELMKESEDFIDEANSLLIKKFNDIDLEEYEDIIEQLNKSVDEDDKTLIKLLIAVVRLDFEDLDKLIADSIGKYTTDIQIPKIDLEEDM